MNKNGKIGQFRYLCEGFLNSYSQVFFSDHIVFALLILLITFLVPASGIAGMAAVSISLLLAKWLGFDKLLISKGIFSYNSLLVALPLGLYFEPGWSLALIIVLASLLTFFLTVAFRGTMLKSNLPFLSWPFVTGLWIVMLAVRRFTSVEVGDQSLFELNRLYEIGGIPLVNSVEWFDRLTLPQGLKTYLISLGAVFFQYNLIAGLVVAIGLVISSRISFLLSLTGFFSAYLFYSVIGLDINSLDYNYIGFNYILTAIAVGGFFIIPSVYSFLWSIALVPVVALLTVSMEELLSGIHLSVYALPFNLLVPAFLYVLYQRRNRPAGLQPVVVQHNSPEKNLYAWSNYHNRLSQNTGILFRLPFMGSWTVSQGHNGSLTHQSDWRFAWDFIKEGPDGRNYTGNGSAVTDYFGYGKPVYPAGDGVVDTVTDGVPDNRPGDANTSQNWGNTVVIKHADTLYTKYSHLKAGTIRVKTGDYVKINMELAQVGNSGRSPEPHLHFQFQAEPNVSAATVDYPFGYYLLDRDGKRSLRTYDRPAEKDRVSNLIADSLLKKTFHFIPGQRIRVSSCSGNGHPREDSEWEVHTDHYNNSYLYNRRNDAIAWFVNDGQLFYFTHYEGPGSDPLLIFFSACFRIPMMFDQQSVVSDQLPLSVAASKWTRWLQDWIAPFYIFLRSDFSLSYAEADDLLDPAVYTLNSGIGRKVFNKCLKETTYVIMVRRDGTIHITSSSGSSLELTTLTIN